MNKLVISVLCAGILVLTAVLAIEVFSGGRSGVEPGAQGSQIEEVLQSVRAVEARIESLGDRIETLETAFERLPSESPTRDDAAAAKTARAPAEPGRESIARLVRDPELLASALEDESARPLRDFVFDVIQEERQARQEEQARRARERREEMQAMRQGPYGSYNFKVNSLGKKLGLNDFQKQGYYELLVGYRERFQEIRKGVDFRNTESRKNYQQARKDLTEQFSREFVQVLTPQQVEQYNELPAWERSPEGGVSLAVQAEGASTAISGIVTETIEAIDASVSGGGDSGAIIIESSVEVEPDPKTGDR